VALAYVPPRRGGRHPAILQAAADYRLTPRCQQPNAQNKVLMSGLIALSDRDPHSPISLPPRAHCDMGYLKQCAIGASIGWPIRANSIIGSSSRLQSRANAGRYIGCKQGRWTALCGPRRPCTVAGGNQWAWTPAQVTPPSWSAKVWIPRPWSAVGGSRFPPER
jgi:hypothetical protein